MAFATNVQNSETEIENKIAFDRKSLTLRRLAFLSNRTSLSNFFNVVGSVGGLAIVITQFCRNRSDRLTHLDGHAGQ